MATVVGGFGSDSDGRRTKKRDAHEARTPGRHANTDVLAGNGVPQPNIPGKRSGTEHLAPPGNPGGPGEYASSSVFGGPGDQHTAPTTTSAAPAATTQPAPAAHGPVTDAD